MRLLTILSILSLFLIFGCNASKIGTSTPKKQKVSKTDLIMDQVLGEPLRENETHGSRVPKISKPGRCFARVKRDGETMWADVLCNSQITTQLIEDLKLNLVTLGYPIDEIEVGNGVIGPTLKPSLYQFQKDIGFAFGQLDWATVNTLRVKAEAVKVERIIDGEN